MVMRLRKYEKIPNPQFVPRPPPGPRGGAAYRKRKRILTWDIVPFEVILNNLLHIHNSAVMVFLFPCFL